MQIFTSFFFIFWCLHASVYVTSEKPSNDKPSLKDLESLFDSKLKPRSGSFPSSPGPLIQNEGSCSAFDMEIIFHSRANKIYFHKKGCALSLILKVGVCGTRKWPRCNCKWGPSALFTAFQQNYPSHQLVVTPNEMVAFTTVITH